MSRVEVSEKLKPKMKERKHGVKAQILIRYGGINVIEVDQRETEMGGTAPVLSLAIAFK